MELSETSISQLLLAQDFQGMAADTKQNKLKDKKGHYPEQNLYEDKAPFLILSFFLVREWMTH